MVMALLRSIKSNNCPFLSDFGLPEYDAGLLTAERETADFFEETLRLYGGDPKRVSNWMLNEILRLMHDSGLSAAELKISPAALAEIIRMTDEKTVSPATGKELIDMVQQSGKSPSVLVAERGLGMVSDEEAIRMNCRQIIKNHPQEVSAYRSGKETLLGWFVGQLMRETKGRADAKTAGKIFKELLCEE